MSWLPGTAFRAWRSRVCWIASIATHRVGVVSRTRPLSSAAIRSKTSAQPRKFSRRKFTMVGYLGVSFRVVNHHQSVVQRISRLAHQGLAACLIRSCGHATECYVFWYFVSGLRTPIIDANHYSELACIKNLCTLIALKPGRYGYYVVRDYTLNQILENRLRRIHWSSRSSRELSPRPLLSAFSSVKSTSYGRFRMGHHCQRERRIIG